MKAIILSLVFLAAALGALWGYGRLTNTDISPRAVANIGDAALSAYLAKHPEGNKASQFLSESAGRCAFNDLVVFFPDWQKIESPFLFSVPLAFIVNRSVEWALRCRDGSGREFSLQALAMGKFQIDRMVGEPLRLALYAGSRVRVQSNDLHILLRSPRGNLRLQAPAKTTLVLAATGSRKPQVAADIAVLVEEGSVKITPEDSYGSDDGHSLELQAQGGEIKWGPNEEKVSSGSRAQILPSGLHRR